MTQRLVERQLAAGAAAADDEPHCLCDLRCTELEWGQDGAVNEDEYATLLRAIRQRTRQSGRSDLDGLLLESRLLDVDSAKEAVIQYLYGLRDDMALGGETVTRESMRRLRRVQTESGGPVEGIVVAIEEQDRAAYGVDEVDLVGSPQLDQAVREIDALIEQLRDEG